MTAPVFEPAGLAHAALLAGLHQAIFGGSGDEVWTEQAMTEILAMPGSFALLARIGDAPAGLAIGRNAADEVELLTFGILPARRKQGLGLALLRAFCADAHARGAATLFLEVRADNDAALALYRSLGLPVVGRRKGYYRRLGDPHPADALVMTGDLALLALLQ